MSPIAHPSPIHRLLALLIVAAVAGCSLPSGPEPNDEVRVRLTVVDGEPHAIFVGEQGAAQWQLISETIGLRGQVSRSEWLVVFAESENEYRVLFRSIKRNDKGETIEFRAEIDGVGFSYKGNGGENGTEGDGPPRTSI